MYQKFSFAWNVLFDLFQFHFVQQLIHIRIKVDFTVAPISLIVMAMPWQLAVHAVRTKLIYLVLLLEEAVLTVGWKYNKYFTVYAYV